jgi:endonuclease YncB( thermonuclease family)
MVAQCKDHLCLFPLNRQTITIGGVARWLLLFLLLLAQPANAGEISGRVVAIADGDTLTVLASRQQIKVRLLDIDAPERKQPFGTRSGQSLADMGAGKDARIAEQGKDRYERTLGRVSCAGVDANAEQARRGMAWFYERYAPKDSLLYAVQEEARAVRRGLWQDTRPVAPWARRWAKRGASRR